MLTETEGAGWVSSHWCLQNSCIFHSVKNKKPSTVTPLFHVPAIRLAHMPHLTAGSGNFHGNTKKACAELSLWADCNVTWRNLNSSQSSVWCWMCQNNQWSNFVKKKQKLNSFVIVSQQLRISHEEFSSEIKMLTSWFILPHQTSWMILLNVPGFSQQSSKSGRGLGFWFESSLFTTMKNHFPLVSVHLYRSLTPE